MFYVVKHPEVFYWYVVHHLDLVKKHYVAGPFDSIELAEQYIDKEWKASNSPTIPLEASERPVELLQ